MYWGHGSYRVVQGGVALTLMARLIKAIYQIIYVICMAS